MFLRSSLRSSLVLAVASFLNLLVLPANPVWAQTSPTAAPVQADDQRPLSPAQIALFETPHLQNVRQTLTLDYAVVRDGPAAFTDKVAVHVSQIRPDGSKDLRFDFLSGSRRVAYPELDGFRGNPLLMLVMERDVLEMKQTLGLSAAYFRNAIREAFVDAATVADTQVNFDGKMLPAREVSVQPFAHDARLQRLPTVQSKRYTFVLADGIPGSIAEIHVEMPADSTTNLPPFSERFTFQGTEP